MIMGTITTTTPRMVKIVGPIAATIIMTTPRTHLMGMMIMNAALIVITTMAG